MIDASGRVAGLPEGCLAKDTARDIALSIIFLVLGFGFLAGGAYAIVEGWPYLLIERGFTLVITGTVLMTAGVVLLALSRVMAELRRVRAQLTNAVMAVSVASMANAPEEREPAREAAAASLALPAALGGVAAAGGVLAGAAVATSAAAEDRDRKDASSGEVEAARRDEEPDLFAAPEQSGAAGAIAEPEAAWPPAQWRESEPEAAAAPETPDVPDTAATLPVATSDEFAAALTEATGEARPRETEADAAPDWSEPALAPEPDMTPAEPPATTMSSIDEDFDRLRDSLALGGNRSGWDAGAAPTLAGERREPAESEIDAAADWMTAIRPGQERWFGTPLATTSEPEPVSEQERAAEPENAAEPDFPVEPPVWPPQTREAAPFEPEDVPAGDLVAPGDTGTAQPAAMAEPEPDDDELQGEPEPEALPSFALLPDPDLPDAEPADHSRSESEPDFRSPAEAAEQSAPDGSTEPAVERQPEPVEPPVPAASEEGVVGAYQVGTAHFTIYADGSIQARTPDGDYRFASMDELKTYLASEKSRLGA
jgi:hypothetical protein